MIDPKRIRNDEVSVRQGLQNRGCDLQLLDRFVDLDRNWRQKQTELDKLINYRSTMMPKGKPSPEILIELKEVSEKIKSTQIEVNDCYDKMREVSFLLPNIPVQGVPIGGSEEDNKLVRQEGVVPSFSFQPKAHEEIGEALGILDFETGAKLAGSRFVLYKGWGARLERALINFMLDVHTSEHGYEEILPPVIVNQDSLIGTGQLPKFADDCFKISESEYWLSPTAEVQLTNIARDTVIDESELPINYVAYTPCFRREAGSYGKDVKGLIRLHQFNKVELVRFVQPEYSNSLLMSLVQHAETILKKLELPYQVVELCTGDLGFSSSRTFDLEVWLPSQNKYREISSCSCFTDFQSRRSMIRYKDKKTGKINYLHTLNGSGLAIGRTVAAIIENNQKEDGSIHVPSILRSYMGVEVIPCQIIKN